MIIKHLHQLMALSLFGSKLGFSRILDSFMARYGGGHAFGYISAKSKPIWMKYRAL